MRLRTLFCATLACSLTLVAGQEKITPARTAGAPEIPHLRKQGTATQLIVDGKPFLVLGGELSNSSGTSPEYMKPLWSKLADAKVNTILAGVSWNQIEPREGKFDFTALDGIIRDARLHNLRLTLLWFGSWKNSWSSYPPDWVKKDFARFPRVQIAGGKSIEVLSTLSDANRDADAKAFAALLGHVKAVDSQRRTVIMIQVENEIGLPSEPKEYRDRSPLAEKAYAGPAPKELMDYLQQHKDTLVPELRTVWEAAGARTSGTWEQVFGTGTPTAEIFMGWNYARYVGRVVEAGKAAYPIPMFMNAYTYGFAKAGEAIRNSGTPMPDLMDVWRAGAPRVDFLALDIYGSDFASYCADYNRSGNPLFIPETRGMAPYGMEARTLYALGRHHAIGISLMGVERPAATPDPLLTGAYRLAAQLAPLIAKHQGDGSMSAVLLDPKGGPQKIQVGNYTLEVSPQGPPRGAAPSADFAAAIFIAVGPDEYYAAATGVSVKFSLNTPGPESVGIGTVEEGWFDNGRWVPSRQLAGDETGQGQNLSLRSHPADRNPDGFAGIQHFTLYRYR
jgi:hypothetical protein